jgi:hypothetical protein
MIDSVKIMLPLEAAKTMTARLKDFRRRDINTSMGMIGAMRVYQNLDGVTFKGSLAKYLQGENMTPLTRAGVERAINKLETETGLDLSAAVVGSLEVGTSIILKEKPAEYFRLFGDHPAYHKDTYTKGGFIETVLYGTPKGSFSFCAYDKVREMTAKRVEIPELFKGHNVLRLEYRILRRQGIKAKFRRDLTAYDLFDYDTYRDLKNLFSDAYKKIPKTGRGVYIDKTKPITPGRLEQLKAEQFRQSCPLEYDALLQTLTECGALTKKNLDRIRAKDRRMGRDFAISDKTMLIAELDGFMNITTAIGG